MDQSGVKYTHSNSPPAGLYIGGNMGEIKIKGATLEELRSQREKLAKTEEAYRKGILDAFAWENVVQPKLQELDDAIAKALAKIKPPKPTFAEMHAAFLATAQPHADVINQYLTLIDQAIAKENKDRPETEWVMRVIEGGKLIFKQYSKPRGRKPKRAAITRSEGYDIEDHITIILREGVAEIDPKTGVPITDEEGLVLRQGGEESYEEEEETPSPGMTAEEIETAYRHEIAMPDAQPFTVDLNSFLVVVPGTGGQHGKKARYVTPEHFERFKDRYVTGMEA